MDLAEIFMNYLVFGTGAIVGLAVSAWVIKVIVKELFIEM